MVFNDALDGIEGTTSDDFNELRANDVVGDEVSDQRPGWSEVMVDRHGHPVLVWREGPRNHHALGAPANVAKMNDRGRPVPLHILYRSPLDGNPPTPCRHLDRFV